MNISVFSIRTEISVFSLSIYELSIENCKISLNEATPNCFALLEI